MAAAVLLIQHERQRRAAVEAERALELKHCSMCLADLRIDAPGRFRVAIQSMGDCPAGLVEVGAGILQNDSLSIRGSVLGSDFDGELGKVQVAVVTPTR